MGGIGRISPRLEYSLQLDNGEFLTEGPAIVQYLADQKPASHLAPANGTVPRYQLQEWLTFINSEIHKSFAPLIAHGTDDMKKDAKEKIAKRFAYVEKELAGKQFLVGETFTGADAYFFVMLNWAHHLHMDMNPYPNLAA